MGIRFYCPNGHKLNVKEFQAGRKGICPYCGAKLQIPTESTRASSKKRKRGTEPQVAMPPGAPSSAPAAVPVEAPGLQVRSAGGAISPSPRVQPAIGDTAQPAIDYPPGQVPVVGGPGAGAAPGPSPVAAAENPAVAPAGGSPAASGARAPVEVAPAAPGAPAPADVAPAASSTVSDPLTEAGDVVWYVRPASGGQFGPASSDVMRSWLEQGRVGADSLVWREGWNDWREASKVFPQLNAAQGESPLGEITIGEASTTTAATVPDRRARSQRRSKKTQTVVITLLIFTVIVLSCVLVWILAR